MLKKLIFCSLLLCGTFSTAAWCQTGESAEQLLAKGENAEKLGLLDLASTYYQQAQTANPEWAMPDYRLGLVAEHRCHYSQAVVYFRNALTLNDTMANAYAHLATCMIENGNWDPIEDLTALVEKAIELNPKNASPYASMAMINSHQKNYTNAHHWASKAIAIDPKNPTAYNTLGVIYYHQGKDNDAIQQFRKALQMDADNIDAYYNLGVMYVLRNNHETAINYLRKGLQRDNKSVKLYYYLGVAYIQRGDVQKAIACYETIINDIDSLYTPAFNRLGAIYCSKGDYDKAIAYHQKATRIDPNDPESFKCLGKVYTDKGDYPKAIRNLQKAVQLNEKDHETYCQIAKLYNKQNNSARETASYKKAAKLGSKEAQQWMVKHGMAW